MARELRRTEDQSERMVKKTLLQTIIFLVIQGELAGTTIRLSELYKKVEDLLARGAPPGTPANQIALWNELRKCADRGDLPNEPRWKNDTRFAICHATNAGIIKHVGTPKSGEYLRI
jgi:hypothetical protein